MPELFSSPVVPALDANASPLAGAMWKFYQTGTLTPKAVYADAALGVSLGPVVTAGIDGKFPSIYFNPATGYRGRLETADGSLIDDIDPISSGMMADLAATTGAALVGTRDPGANAVPRTAADKLGELLPSLPGQGLAGDGSDEKTLLTSVLNDTTLSRVAFAERDITADGTVKVSRSNVEICGPGFLDMTQVSDAVNSYPALQFRSETDTLVGLYVHDLKASSPASPDLTGGVANNHFLFKFEGVLGARIERLTTDGCDCFVSVQYGAATLADRKSSKNYLTGIHGKAIRGIGLQLIGCQDSNFNAVLEGADFGGTGYALSYGVRLVGVLPTGGGGLTKSSNNHIIAQVSGFKEGLGLQNDAERNTAFIQSNGNRFGCYVVRMTSALIALGNEAPLHNHIHLKHKGGENGLYDGGGWYNTYDVEISDTSGYGIVTENGGDGGAPQAEGNTYRGVIRNFGGERGASILTKNATIDLTIEGVNTTQSVYGISNGNSGCKIDAVVKNCATGVRQAGSGGVLNVVTTGCTTGLEVSGNGNTGQASTDGNVLISGARNTITCSLAGNLTISGNDNLVIAYVGGSVTDSGSNNIIVLRTVGGLSLTSVGSGSNSVLGRVGGAVTNAGSANSFIGMQGASNRGSSTASTDASGEITIAHGLKLTPAFVDVSNTGTTLWHSYQVTSKGSTSIKIKFFDSAGAAMVSTALAFDWRAEV